MKHCFGYEREENSARGGGFLIMISRWRYWILRRSPRRKMRQVRLYRRVPVPSDLVRATLSFTQLRPCWNPFHASTPGELLVVLLNS
jgi:hypothetical protein